jgi:hypothetical protein
VFAPEAEQKLAELQAHAAKPGSPTVAQRYTDAIVA